VVPLAVAPSLALERWELTFWSFGDSEELLFLGEEQEQLLFPDTRHSYYLHVLYNTSYNPTTCR